MRGLSDLMVAIALDSNLWRYIVDAGAQEDLYKAQRATGHDIVILPAVLYETLRMPKTTIRDRLIRFQTRRVWARRMPEAFSEAMDIRSAIATHHPEWLIQSPDLRDWHRLKADWEHGTWDRARRDPESFHQLLKQLDHDELKMARVQSQMFRDEARRYGERFEDVDVMKADALLLSPVHGWDGQPFQRWRAESMMHWNRTLLERKGGAHVEWLAPWLDLDAIRQQNGEWVRFWTRSVGPEDVPREWIRTAMRSIAATRKPSPGTPVDVQISTYLLEIDHFWTADRVFAECVERLQESFPGLRLARSWSVPAGTDGVTQVLGRLAELR